MKSPVVAFLSNVVVFLLKLLVAVITSSKTALVESLRSFADLINSALVYVGNRFALRKDDEDFSVFGKSMYIYVTSFAIGISTISSLALFGVLQTISAFESPHTITNSSLGVAILAIALTLDVASMVFAYIDHRRFLSERGYGNPLIKYVIFENVYDVVGGVSVLIALSLSFLNLYIDAVTSVVPNALLIIYVIRLIRESLGVLVYRSAPAHDIARAIKIALSNPAVRDVNSVKTFAIEPNKYVLVMDVELDPNLSLDEVNEVIDEVKNEISKYVKSFGYIHIEPRKPDAEEKTHRKLLRLLSRRRGF